MKIIVNENERAFLFKNGKFKKMLLSGKYNVNSFLGEKCLTTRASGRVDLPDVEVSTLLKDKNFADSVTAFTVPDLSFAMRYEDDKAVEALKVGTYYFWNIFQKQTFELFDISKVRVEATKEKLSVIPREFYRSLEIAEGEQGLLYFDGKFVESLKAGTYYFWQNQVNVFCKRVEMRTQQLDVNSQEILTADKVLLRLNFVCSYKVTDAVKISNDLKDYKNQIYVKTQLVLREYVGRLKFDELLEQKDSIAGIVLEKLKEKEADLFIEFTEAGLKDIILPGEIREIMNTVLIAEKTAQANVISRREEVASTRSLLNTAKLMDENTTLYKLKELEYLEKICDKVGNISVGNGNLLSELNGIFSKQ